jgi:glycosyltransferase involved in cell wall biosynthesis
MLPITKPRKLRVLWFVNTPFSGDEIGTNISGGRGGWLSNLAGVVRGDIELHLASIHPYRRSPVTAGNVTTWFIKPDFWRIRLLTQSLFNYRFLSDFDIRHAINLVNAIAPDIIHIHGTERSYIELLDPKWRLNKPIAVSLQGIMGSYSRQFPGGFRDSFLFSYFYNKGGRLNSILPKRFIGSWDYTRRQARREQMLLQFAPYIDGRTTYDKSAARFLAPNAKYFHIDRVLRPEFLAARWTDSAIRPLLLHSTLSDSLSKGFDLILEAYQLLSRPFPELTWNVAGLTESSKIVAASLKKLGCSLPSGRIRLIGSLSATELINCMKDASLFVLTSYCENSPNSLAEAQVLGVPCIASNVGGVSTYLRDGLNGILFPPGDPLALAGAISSAIDDRERLIELSNNAREEALRRHAPETIRQQLLEMYDSIVGKVH